MKLLEQLQQIMPLADAATIGPWFLTTDSDDYGTTYLITPQTNSATNEHGEYNDLSSVGSLKNAAFIAAARNLLTPDNLTLLVAALQAARTAQKDLDVLRSMLCGIGVVGGIDGWPVIRRDSVIELTDRFRHV